ncbi:ribonuclease H-like domain-containing protein [Tanacetum coccineum]
MLSDFGGGVTRCLVSLTVNKGWTLYQLDVNNAFLYGDLDEDVYMSLPEGLFKQSKSDYSLFIKSKRDLFIAFLVYVDDIVLSENNIEEINRFKDFLKSKFLITDLGKLKYFLGIEVVDTDTGLYLNQRKYCLELLTEYGLLASKPALTPIETNVVVSDIVKRIRKKRSVEKPDLPLTDLKGYQNMFMHKPLQSHVKLAMRGFRYLKGSSGNLLHGFFYFFGNSLVSWKCKKQKTLATYFAEAEYRDMASVTCEVIWILNVTTVKFWVK